MTMAILHIPLQVWMSQIVLGLFNGAFYAILSLGLALIFGLLKIGNFTHGALYMVGAFVAWWLMTYLGIGYWPALIISPIAVAAAGMLIERTMIRQIADLPHVYGLLLTFGLTLEIEGSFRQAYGTSGLAYPVPGLLDGGWNLGFMFLPIYRAWVIGVGVVLCFGIWWLIEKTPLGSTIRAATENPPLTRALGIRVPRLVMLTFGLGVGLAGFAGVLAAPIFQVNPLMGSNLVIIGFAVVVIGGVGSIFGSIVAGLGVGLVEGLTKVIYPQASTTIIFVLMAIILLVRPAGLFGKVGGGPVIESAPAVPVSTRKNGLGELCVFAILLAIGIVAPMLIYPSILMQALCFALFASAFNLLIGYTGLLSFGHAAFFGAAAYVTAIVARDLHMPPAIAILSGTAAAGLLGAVFGWISIRRQGVYFAMITLALSQVVYFYAMQTPFASGEDGIQGVPRGALFGLINLDNQTNLYYFVLAIFIIGFAIIRRIIHSPFGRVLKSIRENEPRAISLGYDTDLIKLVAFTLSSALAGLAGATKTIVFQVAAPSDIHWMVSGFVILMVLTGGLGTVLGPTVGALILTAMDYYFAEFGSWLLVIEGVFFIVFVMVFRRGVVGEILVLAHRWRHRDDGSPTVKAVIAGETTSGTPAQ
jgi:branched-chain amino acid transport system permease protein